MKLRILVILLSYSSITNIMYAQTEQMKFNEIHFPSVFANIKSGKYEGTANGILLLKNPEGKQLVLDFQGSLCELTLEEDEYEVYDVSTKKYLAQTTSGKTRIRYETYNLANQLSIEYQGQFYNIGLLDGAHDMIIDGLSYTYIPEKETEYLMLTAKKELKLSNYRFLLDELIKTDKENVTDRIQQEVIEKEQFIRLLPNSVIIFAIKR